MNIKSFKPGDIITRIKPSKVGDHSYLCDKMELIEIKSRNFYCKYYSDSFPYENRKLELSEWGSGWEFYIENDTDKKLKDQYDRKRQIDLQIDKFSNERNNNGTVFVITEQNQFDKKIRGRMDNCDALWLNIHELITVRNKWYGKSSN